MELDIKFTENEQEVLNEAWDEYMRRVTLISRLHGLKPRELDFFVLNEDRTGLRRKMDVASVGRIGTGPLPVMDGVKEVQNGTADRLQTER